MRLNLGLGISLILLKTTVCQDEITLSSCLNNREFLFVSTRQSFEESGDICIENNAFLVKVDSLQVNDFVSDFALGINQADYWIGLSRESGTDENSPQSFTFVDSTVLGVGDFGGVQGILPWKGGNPNGIDTFCVSFVDDDLLWQDENCSKIKRAVCERICTQEEAQEDEEDSSLLLFVLLGIGGLIGVVLVFVFFVVFKRAIVVDREVSVLSRQESDPSTFQLKKVHYNLDNADIVYDTDNSTVTTSNF